MAKIGFRVNKFYGSQQAGIPKAARNLINEIAKQGKDNEYLLLEDNQIGVNISYTRYPISVDSEKMVSLQCMSEKVDILHSIFDTCTDISGDIKKILTINDIIPMLHPDWYGNSPQWAKWSKDVKRAAKAADCIIAISESTRNDIIEHIEVEPEKVKTIYLGLDSNLKKENYKGDITGSKWDLTDRYLLSVCTLEPKKNLVGLLRAYEMYRRQHKDDYMQLVIVGKVGWLTDSIFDAINKTPYAKDVIVTGYVTDEELLSLYVNAFAFAYVSLYEGFGLPILEGMAMGKAVITSNISSMPEVGGDAAVYCNPYEIESIAEAINKLAADDAYRKELEKKSIMQASKFTYLNTAKNVLDLYKTLI